MAIKTTRWEPDTCGCVLAYQWDDTVPQDQRVHTAVESWQRPVVEPATGMVLVDAAGKQVRVTESRSTCKAHAQHATAAAQHAAIMAEVKRRSDAWELLASTLPSLVMTVINTDGSIGRTPAPGVTIEWGFNNARALVVTITGATPPQKKALQTACTSQFGAGAIVVQ